MTKRMLIDATHAEETRVVVLDGNRLEDFDVETANKRHLKGNIYLAKVVRVEPSLQAAFVEYGGNRHGFLAFSEIHPDYYQIPIADRQRLLEMEAEEARREEEEEDLELTLRSDEPDAGPRAQPQTTRQERKSARPDTDAAPDWAVPGKPLLLAPSAPVRDADAEAAPAAAAVAAPATSPTETPAWANPALPALLARPVAAAAAPAEDDRQDEYDDQPRVEGFAEPEDSDADDDESFGESDGIPESPPPETVGGDLDGPDEPRERRMPSRFMRNYKIQEVIRRRQILLIQVVKEERGTKGAALTTYLSLAGRFGVLMPNSPRGGGISRKITSAADRRRLKEITAELDLPRGMGLIIRTAGAARPKPEIKRDCEYLLRLWDDIREHTMKSVAPALIYEEASLIKRTIRDVYSRDIDEIMVDGEEGWRAAHDFMRMLMPSHAKKVQLWRDANAPGGGQPLFARYQVEAQLDAMLMPIVQLRSGGYLVINQAEALVAIDVNSGRSTRERNIEETALRTNLEAADEVARQLRLRDLAGLIVIDFIDMESKRHNAMVERRLKEALKNDRARIQVGHISHFGLMEMSRQRLRPSLAETSFITCPHCAGMGLVRGTESAAVHILRGIEEEGSKRRAAEIIVHVATAAALYLLNNKRERLLEIEQRYGMRVVIAADDSQLTAHYRIERVRPQIAHDAYPVAMPHAPQPVLAAPMPDIDDTEPDTIDDDDGVEAAGEDEGADDGARNTDRKARAGETEAEAAERRRPRRRRRRRTSRRDGDVQSGEQEDNDGSADAQESDAEAVDGPEEPASKEPVSKVAASEEPDAAVAPQPASMPSEAPTNQAVTAGPDEGSAGATASETTEPAAVDAETADKATSEAPTETEEEARNRRRGRRGGRRRRREPDGELSPLGLPGAEQPDLLPAYTGPTPANPFGSQVFDIFDVIDQVERAAEVHRPATMSAPTEPSAAQPPVIEMVTPETSEAVPVETTAPDPAQSETVIPFASASESPAPESPVAERVAELPAAQATETAELIPSDSAAPQTMATEPVATEPVASEVADVTPAEAAAEQTTAPVEGPAMANGAVEEPTTDVTPAVPTAANDVAPAPVIKPIVIGSSDVPVVEKKRGWWRR